MRKRDPQEPMFGLPVGRWHKHFAWWPVRLFDGRLAWLRTIERRLIQLKPWLDGPLDQWWQYRGAE